MSGSISIWQIYYQAVQKSQLDSAFVPLDNSRFPSETHELAVFQRLHTSGATAPYSAWGALSWRFAEKTGLSGHELLQIVQQSPSVDVFYMNPFPHIEALFASPWWHGEVAHPDLLEVGNAFLDAAGLSAGMAEVTYRAENTIELSEDDQVKMQKIIDALEELDDVQEVYHNAAL